MQSTLTHPKKLLNLPGLPFSINLFILCAVMVLVTSAAFALINFPETPNYPDASTIVEEKSFEHYVGLVNTFTRFLTTIVGILIFALLLTLLLLGTQLYLWSRDRRRLTEWQHAGLMIERIEFLSGNRLRLNSTEIELNRAQYGTLRLLIERRLQGESLHPSELPGDNGTQMIKRLREELGGRLMEQTLIKNRRGKGYWAEIPKNNIHIRD